jgi:hypothetical protein
MSRNRGLAAAFAVVALALLGSAASAEAAPSLTIASPLEGSSMADKTPVVDGTTTYEGAEVVVNVYAAGDLLVPVQTLTSGAENDVWNVGLSALSDGTYTAVAEQVEVEGEPAGTASVTFTVDTTPPSVSLTAPSSPTNNTTPSFSGTAEAGSSSVTVHIFNSAHQEAVLAFPAAVNSEGEWGPVASSQPLAGDGRYEVLVEQSDADGNVGKATGGFVLDTIAPSLTITSPKSRESMTSSRPTFSGTTNNEPGEPQVVTLEIFAGESASGTPAQTLETTQKGTFWSTGSSGPRLSNGFYTLRATELDAAGNLGVSPPVTFLVASPAPSVTLDQLPRYTNDATPNFGGTAAVNEAKPEVTVKIWRGLSASGSVAETVHTTESGGAWSATPSEALPEGSYTAQAEQSGEPGDPAGVSTTTTFTVDTTAPVLSLSAPPASPGLETVSGTAGVAAGDRRQVTVELFTGTNVEAGDAFETLTVNAVEGVWSATFGGLGSGEYSVIARQSDEAGNVGASNVGTFTVNVPQTPAPPAQVAPSPPTASFTWIPSTPTVGQSVSLVSSSTDPSAAISSFAWDLASNGQFAAGGPAATTSFATPGPHLVRLHVSDGNGLSSTAAETIVVAAAKPKLMQPFPIVRIAGTDTSFGARVRLLTVQAPLGATISLSCVGGGCKTKAERRVAKASSKSSTTVGAVTLKFARFERALRAGARLQIRVTQEGEIGKYTSFAIRRNRLPVRTDACLAPASTKPIACPV